MKLVGGCGWLLRSAQQRVGASHDAGRFWGQGFSSAPTAAFIHGATGRGRRRRRGDAGGAAGAVAVAVDGAGLGYGGVGCDDWGTGRRQGRADVMVVLGGRWSQIVHNPIVALLALR